MIRTLHALEHIRRMPGGSQAHLMKCSDRNNYVVKFQNNPQGPRILANELLGSLLAGVLQLPIPRMALIHVSEEIIRRNPDMKICRKHGSESCRAGLCFGSHFPSSLNCPGGPSVMVFRDDLPGSMRWDIVENKRDFLGMLVFDKWTCNTDKRQCIFIRNSADLLYTAEMIDQGNCFGGEYWTFGDGALQGLCRHHEVYQDVVGVEDFEGWLRPLENEIDQEILRGAADLVPPKWYGFEQDRFTELLRRLDSRRTHVRNLISSMLQSCEAIFPHANRGNSEPLCAENRARGQAA